MLLVHMDHSTSRFQRTNYSGPSSKHLKTWRNLMAKKSLTGKRIAILVDQGFEQVELVKPRKALDKAGAQTTVVSPQAGEVRGWNVKKWGKFVAVDVPLDAANPSE